ERQAHREFGSMDWIRENARDARGHRWIETLVADVRYALRQFRRTPLSAFAMMLILSLGIGASTALAARDRHPDGARRGPLARGGDVLPWRTRPVAARSGPRPAAQYPDASPADGAIRAATHEPACRFDARRDRCHRGRGGGIVAAGACGRARRPAG